MRTFGACVCVCVGGGVQTRPLHPPGYGPALFLIRLNYFRKKIKELLLNFLRSEDDYVEVPRLTKLFNTLG